MFGKSKQSGRSSKIASNNARSNVEAAKSSTRRATKNCGTKRTEAAKSHSTKNCGSRKSCGSHTNKKTKNCN